MPLPDFTVHPLHILTLLPCPVSWHFWTTRTKDRCTYQSNNEVMIPCSVHSDRLHLKPINKQTLQPLWVPRSGLHGTRNYEERRRTGDGRKRANKTGKKQDKQQAQG